MKFFRRFSRAIQMGTMLLVWFEDAAADGVITHEEIIEGVGSLIDAAGLADDLKIEVDPGQIG